MDSLIDKVKVRIIKQGHSIKTSLLKLVKTKIYFMIFILISLFKTVL